MYYVDLKGQLMAASAAMTSGEFAAGTPGKLFDLEIAPDARIHQQYAVGPGGRFLVRTRQESTAPITVILNWRVPGDRADRTRRCSVAEGWRDAALTGLSH